MGFAYIGSRTNRLLTTLAPNKIKKKLKLSQKKKKTLCD
jgi:hypothetical protein